MENNPEQLPTSTPQPEIKPDLKPELQINPEEAKKDETPILFEEQKIPNVYSMMQKLDYDDPHLIIKVLEIRRKLNRDTIIVCVGEKRTGKSFGAIKIAETLENLKGKSFDVDTDLFFETTPFLKRFAQVSDQTFVLDEVSVNYNSQDWFNVQNKIFSTLATTQGYKRNVLILTLPILSHLDKRIVHLCHYIFQTYQAGFMKLYKIRSHPALGKAWLQPFSFLKLEMPSHENVVKYLKKKDEWNKKRLGNDIQMMELLEDSETYTKKFNYKEYLEMFRHRVINEQELQHHLLMLNFKEKDVVRIIQNELAKQKAREENPVHRTLNWQFYASMFHDGLIDENEFRDNLTDLKYGEKEIELIFSSVLNNIEMELQS